MIYPKIIRGGKAIPIGNNLFLMKGRKHKNGGIDVGKDLEVEGDEVMQMSPNEIKVFSAQKFLGGESPADLVLEGANPNQVFAAQEQYKDIYGINDDGTKKKTKEVNSDNIKFPVKGNNKKQYSNMSKVKKDTFIDSLIESMNSLNKTKLNNTNNDNMSPIDLQILNRELNKDVLLRNSHSTGVQNKKCGGRKKAIMGTDGKEYVNVADMPVGVKPKFHSLDYSDQYAYKAPGFTFNYGTGNGAKKNYTNEDISNGGMLHSLGMWLPSVITNAGNFLTTVIGSVVNRNNNRKYLNQISQLYKGLKAYDIPPVKLNTNYNINPQVSEIHRQLGIAMRDIDSNTSSSKRAISRKQAAALKSRYELGKLFAQKENAENYLINDEAVYNAERMKRNIENAQTIKNQKIMLEAGILDKRSENESSMINNITSGAASFFNSLGNTFYQDAQLRAGLAASPHGSNAYYGDLGESARLRKEAREKRKQEKKDKKEQKRLTDLLI